MPKIPGPQTERQPTGKVAATPIDVEPLQKVTEGLGKEFKLLQDVAIDAVVTSAKAQDLNAINNKKIEFNRTLRDLHLEEKEKRFGDAAGARQSFLEGAKIAEERLFKDVPSQYRDELKFAYKTKSDQWELKTISHESAETLKDIANQIALKREESKQDVQADPNLMEDEIIEFENFIAEQVATGIPLPDDPQVLIDETTSDIALTAATAEATNNPEIFLIKKKAGTYNDVLSSGDRERLEAEAIRMQKAVDDELKRQEDQAEEDRKEAIEELEINTDADFTIKLEEGRLTEPEIEAVDPEVFDKLKKADWIVATRNRAKGKVVRSDPDTYDSLSSKFDDLGDDAEKKEINKVWAEVSKAHRKEKITRPERDHFEKRRDGALKKADPLNSYDFKAGESRILNWEKNGGFLPYIDEDGNEVDATTFRSRQMTKDEAKDSKDALDVSRENRINFMKKYKKWKQENPNTDSNEWITTEFEPVEQEQKDRTVKQWLDDFF